MDTSLLCDEVWLSTPDHGFDRHCYAATGSLSFLTKEDCERALDCCLDKEMSYMPELGYVQFLDRTQDLVVSRFRAVEWIFKCGRRLSLSLGTVFNAVNYLDRFLSLNQCNGLKYSMLQLLSVACLSVAAKFNETCTPSLHEIQMEGMDRLFDSSMIQRIELTLLDALGWRLSSTTAYSYVELLLPNSHDAPKITNLLLQVLLDPKLLEFRPSVVVASAIKCCLQELLLSGHHDLALMTKLIPRNSEDDLIKCNVIMEGLLIEPPVPCEQWDSYNCPSSPVTVLLTDSRVDIYGDHCADYHDQAPAADDNMISLFKTPAALRKKRKREEQ